MSEVQSSALGPGGLSVYAGQLSAYSENNISSSHRGFDVVLFNLWPLPLLMLGLATLSISRFLNH